MKGKNWIKEAIKNKWALREQLKAKKWENIPKEKIEQAKKSKWKLWARAKLAETLSKLRSKKK
jgi:hypothetical protein